MSQTLVMILKMTAFSVGYAGLTALLWSKTRGRQLNIGIRLLIGVIYGIGAAVSTHFGVDYKLMMLNVRDLAPLCAGLFFDPVSGITAGLIGGIERYIAGTCWHIGYFTTAACSIATCLAGFAAAFLKKIIFNGKNPSVVYSFFIGAAIEAFHMYAVFLTHRNNLVMAFNVVEVCAIPMILFSAFGLALTSFFVHRMSGDSLNYAFVPREERPVLVRLQFWLVLVIAAVVLANVTMEFLFQTRYASEYSKYALSSTREGIESDYEHIMATGGDISRLQFNVPYDGSFVIADASGKVIASSNTDYSGRGSLKGSQTDHRSKEYSDRLFDSMNAVMKEHGSDKVFDARIMGKQYSCLIGDFDDGSRLIVVMPESSIQMSRDMMSYVNMLGILVLFAVIFVLTALLMQFIVVNRLTRVKDSLSRIADGDLDETVSVYESAEFTLLSTDINKTVDVLKGHIDAAKNRMEQDLQLAQMIQESALPKNFDLNYPEYDVYATMSPAREVGGDFYDFFFVAEDQLAVVIADVAGKGLAASLQMMRCKSAIRGFAETGSTPAETFEKVNTVLCSGNDLAMFVTAWMGIVDLRTGVMSCVNAGHNYPALMRKGGSFELFRDVHFMPLGSMEGLEYSEYELYLKPGDIIFQYTDGLPEAVNMQKEQYGTARMTAALEKGVQPGGDGSPASMRDLLGAVHDDLHDFEGDADQFDDETMIGFRYNGVSDKRGSGTDE